MIIKLDSVSVTFWKSMSVLNGLSFWTFLWGKFEVPITLPLFDVFKLFYSLLLTCELIVLNILLLEMYVTFPPCFLLDDVKTISICFTFVKITSVQSTFILKIDKTFNAMSIESRLIMWKILLLTQLSFKNNWQIICLRKNVNSL